MIPLWLQSAHACFLPVKKIGVYLLKWRRNKILKKSAKILIWDNQYFRKNRVCGPKMSILDPRTAKFGILVKNYGTKLMSLEFLKNHEKWPFLNFGSILSILTKTRAAVSQWPDLALTKPKLFFYVVSIYAKLSKIGPKKMTGYPPSLLKRHNEQTSPISFVFSWKAVHFF